MLFAEFFFSLGSKLRLRYHAMVWIPSLATAIVLVATGSGAEYSGTDICMDD